MDVCNSLQSRAFTSLPARLVLSKNWLSSGVLNYGRSTTQHSALFTTKHRRVLSARQLTLASNAKAYNSQERRKELEGMTVEKGLKPILRAYGQPVAGRKQDLVERVLNCETAGAGKSDDIRESRAQLQKQSMLASSVLEGATEWRTARAKAGTGSEGVGVAGVRFDVAGLVSALALILDTGENISAVQLTKTQLVRLQLEAIARAVEELYVGDADTIYQSQPIGRRNVKVDIDMGNGRMLVAAQLLGRDEEVVSEWDDTERAMKIIQEPESTTDFVDKRGRRQERVNKSGMDKLTGRYSYWVRRLQNEVEWDLGEQSVEMYYMGREGMIVKGTVNGRRMVRRDSQVRGKGAREEEPKYDKDLSIKVMPGVTARLARSCQIPQEVLEEGQEVRAILTEVVPGAAANGEPALMVSRVDPALPLRILEEKVAEVKLGDIEIVGVAREPSMSTKIAVRSTDPVLNPVAICLGKKKWRARILEEELNGERLSVVQWSEEPAEFIANSLQPGHITAEQVHLDEEKNLATVTCGKKDRLYAIGRKGSNVRLAVSLTGWNIKVHEMESEEAEDEKDDVGNQNDEA